jgi:hypothetical protein
MASSIALNVGGASASGAAVFCVNTSGSFAPIIGAADASGNVTFSGLVAGTYRLSGGGNFASGAFKGFTYKSTVDITVDGTTAYTGVVIPAPTAP